MTVINLPRRLRSLGEKLNFMVGVAKSDCLFRWDDDDIFLPWRITTQMTHLRRYSYVTADSAWWATGNDFNFKYGSGFSQVAFRRELFSKTRGFAFMGVGEDQEFERRVRDEMSSAFTSILVNKETAFAIYRWGTGSEHVSGYGDAGYERMGETETLPGHKVLTPRWRTDYVEKVKHICQFGNSESASIARRGTLLRRRR